MNFIKLSRALFFFTLFAFFACNNSDKQKSTETKTVQDDTSATEKLVNIDTSRFTISSFPDDSNYSIKVLTTGMFHYDEVWKDADKSKWFGLFTNKNAFYLKQTQIKTVRIHDPVLDDNENVKTGWEISTSVKDTSLILIETLPSFADRSIHAVTLKEHIFPGENIAFEFLGKDYKIFATGGKRNVPGSTDWYEVWDYKLYLYTEINGQEKVSLLIARKNFDDQMTKIIFAGDIDGDGLLDLIIDASDHYNVTNPTLYLSRPAPEGEIVKPAGGHMSVGS